MMDEERREKGAVDGELHTYVPGSSFKITKVTKRDSQNALSRSGNAKRRDLLVGFGLAGEGTSVNSESHAADATLLACASQLPPKI